jgi:regulator of replication initiation timing
MKHISHIENNDLKTNIFKREMTNSKITDEVSNLQASIVEICEEDTPLQLDNNRLFDEY